MDLLTLQQAADLVGIHRCSLTYHVREGRLAHRDLAGNVMPEGARIGVGSRFLLEEVRSIVAYREARFASAQERIARKAEAHKRAAKKRAMKARQAERALRVKS